MIDTRDVADCIAACVQSNAFDNQAFELTGPASITYHDCAATLSGVLGRTITYVPISPAAVAGSIRAAGWGDWGADVMRDYSQAYRDGWGDFTTDAVERMTGRPPRSFTDFAREVLAPALQGETL